MSERVLLSIDEVCRRTSLSRSKVYELMRDDSDFPKSFRLANTTRVVVDSVALQTWIDKQAEQASAGDPHSMEIPK